MVFHIDMGVNLQQFHDTIGWWNLLCVFGVWNIW